jgi:thiol-disulfide isomerase/thioredoxin
MTSVVLYTTLGCHLCEQAAEMLAALEAEGLVAVAAVEISDDPMLVERYGIRIPVVMNVATGSELGWPFTPEALRSLL